MGAEYFKIKVKLKKKYFSLIKSFLYSIVDYKQNRIKTNSSCKMLQLPDEINQQDTYRAHLP